MTVTDGPEVARSVNVVDVVVSDVATRAAVGIRSAMLLAPSVTNNRPAADAIPGAVSFRLSRISVLNSVKSTSSPDTHVFGFDQAISYSSCKPSWVSMRSSLCCMMATIGRKS